MMRAILTVTLLAGLALTALAPTAAAEEIRVGPCEIDGCVYACVHVEETCRGDHEACILVGFQFWCV